MASLFTSGQFQGLDDSGNPLASGKVHVYQAGTLVRKNTYTTRAGTVANSNPVTLDSGGRADIWLGSGSYRVILKEADLDEDTEGPVVYDTDNVRSGTEASVNVLDYGAMGDGVTDDTDAVTAAHIAANLRGATVSYEGLTAVALQADAQIPMKTSTDFAGCDLVILGGVNETPSFSTFNKLFLITDDDCPLVTVTGAVDAENLVQGSPFPTRGLFDGHGYARVSCAFQVPNRAKTGTEDFIQPFKINRFGRASQYLCIDISAHAAAITVNYRRTSKKRLIISNMRLTEGAWNNQIVLEISRCNVLVQNTTFLYEGDGAVFNNICKIIAVEDASDIHIDTYVSTGRTTPGYIASYNLAITGGADIYVTRMNTITGWGSMGNRRTNGLHVRDSVINRVESHDGAFNIFADNCDFHDIGLGYGWGGGILSVKNSRMHRCPAIFSRVDWGGQFFGSLFVANCEFDVGWSSTIRAVDLETNPIGASSTIYAPETIVVNDVSRVGKASGLSAEFIPVAVKILDASSVVYAPSSITVRNVTCFKSWRFGLRVDLANMEANTSFPTTRISVNGARADIFATDETGIQDFTSIRTPTTPVRTTIFCTDCGNIHIRLRSLTNIDIHLTACSVNGVYVDPTATATIINLVACVLRNQATGYTNAPIGAGVVSGDSYTTIKDTEIYAIEFDLSGASALIGNTIRSGAATPILPAGATATTAFTGWRRSGVFL